MRVLTLVKTGLLAVVLIVPAASAGETTPTAKEAANPWHALMGDWRGEGEVSGMAAVVRLQFQPTLDGRGRRLSFENSMTAKDGKDWRFLAEALYLCEKDGRCRGQWQDSRGMLLPLSTQSQPDRVVVDWGDDATERGRTIYRIADDGSLHMTDEVLGKDGVWKTFGQTRALRVVGGGPTQ